MIVEYIRYELPEAQKQAFEAAYAVGQESLRASPHCHAWELSQCSEAPGVYILRIEWESATAHLDGFRKSPEFGPFLKAVRPYIDFIKEMRHYELTAVIGRRAAR
jgi:quinol monooxygenase YgiN